MMGQMLGQGQQPCAGFLVPEMRCFGLLLHWPEGEGQAATRLTFPSSQLRSGPMVRGWLGASPSTATPTPTRLERANVLAQDRELP